MTTERIVPVFPLPNTVFFPRTTLALHIFEPRYRAMVLDVTRGESELVVALERGSGFAEVATLGRIRELEPLPDGRSNLWLEGVERVALREVPRDTPYRQVRIEPLPEAVGTADATEIATAKLEILSSYGILRRMIRGDEPFVLDETLPFETAVNVACSSLPVDPALRQHLLAADTLMERQRKGLEYLSSVIEILMRNRGQDGGEGGGGTWQN